MNSNKFIPILLGRWRLAFWVFFATTALGTLLNFWIPKQYTSSATVLLDNKSSSASALRPVSEGVEARLLREQVALISSSGMALRVVDQLGLDKSTEARLLFADGRPEGGAAGGGTLRSWLANSLLYKLKVQGASDSNLIDIEFTSPDPMLAAAVVNAFVQSYTKAVADNQSNSARRQQVYVQHQVNELRTNITSAERSLAVLRQQLQEAVQHKSDDAKTLESKLQLQQSELDVLRRSYDYAVQRFWQESFTERPESLQVISLRAAEMALTPTVPRLSINLPLSLLIGLILGIAAALGAELVDRRVRTEREAAEVLGLPVLATVSL